MRSSLSLAVLPFAWRAAADDWSGDYKFGNNFYTGPLSGDVYITKATYSLVPPDTPCNYYTGSNDIEELSIWIGVQDDPTGADVLKMSFVQPLLNWSPDQESTGCETNSTHWCVAASTYHPSGQVSQPYVPVPIGCQIDFEISVNPSTTEVEQKVWINGALISSQSDNAGMKPQVFYSGNECWLKSCGTMNGYSWSNITIHLSDADESYANTLSLYNAITSGFTTSDSGKTWHVDEITIAKDYFYKDNSIQECS